jgi:hypothetical protein
MDLSTESISDHVPFTSGSAHLISYCPSSLLEPHRVPSFCHKRFLVLGSNLAHTDAYVTPCSLSAVHFHATTRDSDVKQCSYLKQNSSVCRVTFELYKRKSWHIRQAVSNTSVRHGRTLCNNNDRARVTRACTKLQVSIYTREG